MSGEVISLCIPGEPVPFARAGANGKTRFTPKKQSTFMGQIGFYASRAMAGRPPFDGPIELHIQAEYLVPASWSKKKQEAAVWKASKPDADNLAKIAKDAMSKIIYRDDAQVVSLTVKKIYSPIARLIIIITEIAP
jgi:Holliday junction resolvase RusA-like endonuclease